MEETMKILGDDVPKNGEPKYRQVAEQLIQKIRSGELKPGTRLLGERAFAEEFGLSVATTVAVMRELCRRGYIIRRRKSGTYVADPEPLRRPRIGFICENAGIYRCRINTELWKCCFERNCDLLPLFRSFDQLESTIADYRLDGVLVFNSGEYSRREIQHVQQKGVPILLLSSVEKELEDISFGYSNDDLLNDAVRYLAGLEYSQIGLLLSWDSGIPNGCRLESFYKAMWSQRLPVNPEWVISSGMSDEQLDAYLTSPNRPDAVIIGNCYDQPCVMEAIRRNGLSVPEELSVLALDTYPFFTSLSRTELTCFQINVADFSCQAIDYLLRKIRGENPEKLAIRNYEFSDAGSCIPRSRQRRKCAAAKPLEPDFAGTAGA